MLDLSVVSISQKSTVFWDGQTVRNHFVRFRPEARKVYLRGEFSGKENRVHAVTALVGWKEIPEMATKEEIGIIKKVGKILKKLGQGQGYLDLKELNLWVQRELADYVKRREGEGEENIKDLVKGRLVQKEGEDNLIEITKPEIIKSALEALGSGDSNRLDYFRNLIKENPSLLFNLLGLDFSLENLDFKFVERITRRGWLKIERKHPTDDLAEELLRRFSDKEEKGEIAFTLFARLIEDRYNWRFLMSYVYSSYQNSQKIGVFIKEAAEMLGVDLDPANPQELASFLAGVIKVFNNFIAEGIVYSQLNTKDIARTISYTALAIEKYRSLTDPLKVKELAEKVVEKTDFPPKEKEKIVEDAYSIYIDET